MAKSPDPLTVARDLMAPGERLIWAERPLGQAGRRGRLGLMAFGSVFTLVALFWTGQAWADGLPIAWIGLLLAGLGLALMTSAWWRRSRARMVYAVSDRRLLIVRDGPDRKVRSFAPGDIETIEHRERADGSGDLIFRRETVMLPRSIDGRGPRYPTPRIRRVGFFDIPEVRRVEAAVRALKERKPVGDETSPAAR